MFFRGGEVRSGIFGWLGFLKFYIFFYKCFFFVCLFVFRDFPKRFVIELQINESLAESIATFST